MDVLALCSHFLLYPNEVNSLDFPNVGLLHVNTAFVYPRMFLLCLLL